MTETINKNSVSHLEFAELSSKVEILNNDLKTLKQHYGFVESQKGLEFAELSSKVEILNNDLKTLKQHYGFVESQPGIVYESLKTITNSFYYQTFLNWILLRFFYVINIFQIKENTPEQNLSNFKKNFIN